MSRGEKQSRCAKQYINNNNGTNTKHAQSVNCELICRCAQSRHFTYTIRSYTRRIRDDVRKIIFQTVNSLRENFVPFRPVSNKTNRSHVLAIPGRHIGNKKKKTRFYATFSNARE